MPENSSPHIEAYALRMIRGIPQAGTIQMEIGDSDEQISADHARRILARSDTDNAARFHVTKDSAAVLRAQLAAAVADDDRWAKHLASEGAR
jgi:hypothetical protein